MNEQRSTPWALANEWHNNRMEMERRAARTEQAEAERDRLRKRDADASELLQLAYQVYRDAGGKVGSSSIFSFGEWLQWLPTQTDESLIEDFRA